VTSVFSVFRQARPHEIDTTAAETGLDTTLMWISVVGPVKSSLRHPAHTGAARRTPEHWGGGH
jgi:hypothetical protein